MEFKLYICPHCGNVVWKVVDQGVPVVCCGQKMEELVPGTTDASQEKHVPAIQRDGDTVKISVGSVEHPMLEEHHISVIAAVSGDTVTLHFPRPGDAPHLTVNSAAPVTAYEICNLHGFWKGQE